MNTELKETRTYEKHKVTRRKTVKKQEGTRRPVTKANPRSLQSTVMAGA